MPASPSDVVRKVYEAWQSRDLTAVGELYGPDVVFDWSRRQLHALVAEGRSAALRATSDLFDSFVESGVEIERLVEEADRVIALVHARGRGRTSGALVEAHVGHVWTVRDGLIQRMEYYGDQAEALATADRGG